MSSLRRGHANLLCIVPILVYVLPKRALFNYFFKNLLLFGCAVSLLLCVGFLALPRAGLFSVVAPGLWSAGSVAVALGFSCSAACGVFPGQGSNSRLLHRQAGLTPEHQRSPCVCFLWQLAGSVVGIVVTERSPAQPLARGRHCAPGPC